MSERDTYFDVIEIALGQYHLDILLDDIKRNYDSYLSVDCPEDVRQEMYNRADEFAYQTYTGYEVDEFLTNFAGDLDYLVAERNPNGKSNNPVEGYVYLATWGDGDLFKIGKSINPIKRVKKIGVVLPEPLHIIHLIKTNDYTRLERFWHETFAEYRKRGEWFELPVESMLRFMSKGEYYFGGLS